MLCTVVELGIHNTRDQLFSSEILFTILYSFSQPNHMDLKTNSTDNQAHHN